MGLWNCSCILFYNLIFLLFNILNNFSNHWIINIASWESTKEKVKNEIPTSYDYHCYCLGEHPSHLPMHVFTDRYAYNFTCCSITCKLCNIVLNSSVSWASFHVRVDLQISFYLFIYLSIDFFLFIYLYLFIYYFWLHWVFVAAHGLSLVAVSGGLLFVAVHGLLIAVASLAAEHGLQ